MAWTSQDIEAVEEAIRKRISGGGVQSYAVGGRNVAYMTLTELRSLLAEMRREVEAETSGAGGLPISYIAPGRSRR